MKILYWLIGFGNWATTNWEKNNEKQTYEKQNKKGNDDHE